MTDHPSARVQFARRFVATIPGQPDIHGVQFPDSGRVLTDDPHTGLTAFFDIDSVTEGIEGAAIHWADETSEEQP